MRAFAFFALASCVTAGHVASRAETQLRRLFERQLQLCASIPAEEAYGPNGCALSCGQGYVRCISYPTCYNPGAGETCCSDGSYCPARTYCTDAGCCDEGLSLEECGASHTLKTIAPPATTSAESATSKAPSTEASPTSYSSAITYSSTTTYSSASSYSSATSATTYDTITTPVVTYPTTPSAYHPVPSHKSFNGTTAPISYSQGNATASFPAQQTVNAGQRTSDLTFGFNILSMFLSLFLL